jgi:hypothetical protein
MLLLMCLFRVMKEQAKTWEVRGIFKSFLTFIFSMKMEGVGVVVGIVVRHVISR